MDANDADMPELCSDAVLISLLCDAGCSERPTVSTIIEVGIPVSLIFMY